VTQVLRELARDYPQLYLNPDRDSQEDYRRVVLRGGEPTSRRLSHYVGSDYDLLETVDTPAGPVRVLALGDRRDFELVVRGLMAAKNGPQEVVPDSQGAATFTVINWRKIKWHLAEFPKEEQKAEFKRFTSVRENYIDMLVVLSRGPYSNVDAAAVGAAEEPWLELSDTIRRYHELTHVICRRLHPGDVDAVRDELIADAIGLYAAFGRFDPATEELFLGIRDGRYVGGRLENYTEESELLAPSIARDLCRMKDVVDARSGVEPFALIAPLMQVFTA
jgi:hypothetical protein